MKTEEYIPIVEVSYIGGYKLKVKFNNGAERIADFEKFVLTSEQPMTNQFKDIERFKKAYIDAGHITWEDGQMDIACWSVYNGDFD